MKKLFVLFCAIGMVVFSGCKKDKEEEAAVSLDNKVLINEIFKAGMSWNPNGESVKSSVPINIQVDNTVTSPIGGNIHVLGSVTGTMNIDDESGVVQSGTLLLGLTETINDYAFKCDDQTFVMNGAPYLSLTGTFTLGYGGSFGSASSMQFSGGIRVTGPDFDQTINVQITIILNPRGTGGHVSGTVGGVALDYNF